MSDFLNSLNNTVEKQIKEKEQKMQLENNKQLYYEPALNYFCDFFKETIKVAVSEGKYINNSTYSNGKYKLIAGSIIIEILTFPADSDSCETIIKNVFISVNQNQYKMSDGESKHIGLGGRYIDKEKRKLFNEFVTYSGPHFNVQKKQVQYPQNFFEKLLNIKSYRTIDEYIPDCFLSNMFTISFHKKMNNDAQIVKDYLPTRRSVNKPSGKYTVEQKKYDFNIKF